MTRKRSRLSTKILTIATTVAIAAELTGTVYAHKTLYPQVYDLRDLNGLNLYTMPPFRLRNARFLNELSDSTRSLTNSMRDSAGFSMIFLLKVNQSGAMDSACVECSDSSCSRLQRVIHDRLMGWHFAYSPQTELSIVQDVHIKKSGGGGKNLINRKFNLATIGLILVGILVMLK
jgi:hypothetical protein